MEAAFGPPPFFRVAAGELRPGKKPGVKIDVERESAYIAAARRGTPPSGVTPVTACRKNFKVLKKYDSKLTFSFDTGGVNGLLLRLEVRMSRTLNQTLTTFLRAAPIVALALIAVASASPAAAQTHCASWADTLLDTTNNCVSEPWRPRASDVQTFRWNGHDYMVLHTGNEISIYNIDDPANPSHTSSSDFDFGTRGDSDYDLIDFDFCDDCRYPILSHKVKRTVIFDLGGGSTPAFQRGAWADYNAVDKKIGGYVFKKGGQQYVMTASGPADCSGSALYTVGSPSRLGFVSCIGWGGLSSIV